MRFKTLANIPKRKLQTVWIVDAYDYIDYIERALRDIADNFDPFRWVKELQRSSARERQRKVSWEDALKASATDRYDELIDWIITKQLNELYYFGMPTAFNDTQEHLVLLNILVTNYDLDRATSRLLTIPKIYNDVYDAKIRRAYNWIYISAHVSNQAEEHVLRHKKKGR